MRAISAIQVEATRVNENLRSEAHEALNQARSTINEQRSQIMLLREQEVEVNRQQAINIQRCLELSEINRNKDEEIRMLRAQLETKAKASESIGSPQKLVLQQTQSFK